MRISKLLLTVCVAAVCAGFTSVRAQQDNPAQAAARAALEQKLRELDAQSPQTNTAPTAPQKEAPPAQPAPKVGAAKTPAPFATAVSTPPTATDIEAQKKAQAALEEKMQELNRETELQKQSAPILVNSSGTVVVETPTNRPPPEKAAPTPAQSAMTPSGGSSLFAPAAPTPPNTEAQTAAQQALQQTMPESNQGQMAAQPAAKPAAPESRRASGSSPAAYSASYAAKEPGFQPIVAPPLPISTGKQAQLQALTAKYMANQISPEAYFEQREKILAEPDAAGQ